MQLLNELLENAIIEIFNRHKSEFLKNITLNITIDDIEKIVKQNEFFLLNRISDFLAEDTDDFELVEKIVCLFEENHISCGGRHDF